MQFNDYSIFLLICGCAALIMSIFIFKNVRGVGRSYGILTFGVAIWSIAYSFELNSSTLQEITFWTNIEYIGIGLLPAFWVVFILRFIGKSYLLTPLVLFGIFLIPCLTLIGVWTNDYHHLHYKDLKTVSIGSYTLVDITIGPWYIVHTIYFYVSLMIGIYLLFIKFIKADAIYRKQNSILIIGSLFPWFVNVLYLFDVKPLGYIDLTPFAFLVTCFIIGLGLLRFHLFDIVPVAREKVLEELRDGIIVLDAKNRIIDLNHTMKKILGFTKNYVFVGKEFSMFFPDEKELHYKVLDRTLCDHEIEIHQKDQYKFFNVNLTPLFEKDTAYSGLIMIFRDLTERKLADNRLQDQANQLTSINELKDKLFSIIAHDLRGPMLNLNEIMNLFEKKLITDDEFKLYIPMIASNIKSTSSLLENLLYWSRTQLKGERIHPECFNLRLTILMQVNLFESSAKEKGIIIRNWVPEDYLAFADKNMIELVIRNLISNSVKYCKEGDMITINAHQEENYKIVCISDTGTGISKANMERLFGIQNFTTIGTNQEKGTGLGLFLCKDFIEKNNGKIWVESEEGKGSKFCFSIPNTMPAHS